VRFIASILAIVLFLGCDTRPIPECNNLLFITVDTLRADVLGCYGNEGGHTPVLDDLARQSALFMNCIAPMATTTPSHASMFTGLYPRFHGVRWNGNKLDERFDTVAEILYEHGWNTAAFVAAQAMVDNRGLDQGFADLSGELDEADEETGIRSGQDVNAFAKEWFSSRDDERPFFLWLHYFEPHGPYPVTPHARATMEESGYNGLFQDGASMEELQERKNLDDPDNCRILRALYEGRVREADRLVGEVLDLLKAHGLEETTALVVTGDHGQLLGETIKKRPLYGHGPILWEKALHVPLIMRIPGKAEPLSVPHRVSLIDLAPTLLELAGLVPPARLQGKSLGPALEGKPFDEAVYVAEIRVLPEESYKPRPDRIAVYEKNLKVHFPERLVYDMSRKDPEAKPLAKAKHKELIDRLARIADGFYQHKAGVNSSLNLDEDDIARLRALGYIK
jgi:arylsulfatase